MTVRDEIERHLLGLPGLVRGPSRYDHGSAFRSGGREIAHFHGERRLDVRLTRGRIAEMKAEGPLDSRVLTRGPSAEWVEVRVAEPADVALAVTLVEEAVRANS